MEENTIAHIGINAGLIWSALGKLGKTDVKRLKKAAEIRTERDVYATLGWLVKGEKLTFVYEDGMLPVPLR